jgi:hypothetical protein
MTLWRSRAGVLLSAVFVLDASLFVDAKTVGPHIRGLGVFWGASNTSFLLAACAVDAFLMWRVWRGGSVALFLLLYLVGVSAGQTISAMVSSFDLYGLGLLVLLLAQFTLLISPAIRARRHRSPVASSR